jgi:hypothetical protein
MNDERDLYDKYKANGDFDGCIVGGFSTAPHGGELYVDTDDVGEIPHFHIRNYYSGTGNRYGF